MTIQEELTAIRTILHTKLQTLNMEQRVVLMYRIQQLVLTTKEPKVA